MRDAQSRRGGRANDSHRPDARTLRETDRRRGQPLYHLQESSADYYRTVFRVFTVGELADLTAFILKWVWLLPWNSPAACWLWGEYEVLLFILTEHQHINPDLVELYWRGHLQLSRAAQESHPGDMKYAGEVDAWQTLAEAWLDRGGWKKEGI